MFTYDQVKKALQAEGLKVIEVPGSRDRCRCHEGSHAKNERRNNRGWNPQGNVMVHITAGGKGKRTAQEYIRDIINGDPEIPNKAHFVPDTDGTVYLNSVGRANHAGTCGSRARTASRNQSLSTKNYQDLRGSDIDGNTEWWGIENIAATSMTKAQREASVKICVAMNRLSKRNGKGNIGHGEASSKRSKADPNLNMGQFRADVATRLAKGGARKVKVTRYRITMPGKGELVAVGYHQPKRGKVKTRARTGKIIGVVGSSGNYLKTEKGTYFHKAFARKVG